MIRAEAKKSAAADLLLQHSADLAEEKAILQDMLTAAEPVAERLSSMIPVGPGIPKHTKDDIIVQPVQSESGRPTIKIGARSDRKDGRGFILRFIEFGTRFMAARPVVRPTLEATRSSFASDVTASARRRA